MKLRKTLALAASVSMLSMTHAAFADQHADVDQLAKQVRQLQRQINTLKRNTVKPKKQTSLKTPRRSTFTSRLGGMPVTTSPYVGQQTAFDGGHLLVMYPTVNEDLRLLQYRRHSEDALNKEHTPQPDEPFIKLSGKIEAVANAARDYDRKKSNDADLDSVELAVLMGVSRYVTGFFTFDYDSGEKDGEVRRTKNSNLYLNKGFITIGNFNESPVYFSIGQMYPAFGRYGSAMWTSPLTRSLGRIHNRAVALGYSQQGGLGFYGSVFAFRGETKVKGHGDKMNEGGANLDYVFNVGKFHTDLGVSYVSNLSESENLTSDGKFGYNSEKEPYTLERRVAGVDVHALVKRAPFTLLAEYVSALKHYDKADLMYRNKAAKPRALQLELGFDFDMGHLPGNFAVGFNRSYQAAAIDNMPKKSYSAVFNTSLLKDTVQTLEFRHDVEYSEKDGSAAIHGTSATSNIAGRHNNTVTAAFGIYF